MRLSRTIVITWISLLLICMALVVDATGARAEADMPTVGIAKTSPSTPAAAAEPTTTTTAAPAPTTTTAPPPPPTTSTTSAPVPAAPPAPAPVAAPAPVRAAGDPGTSNLLARVKAAYNAAIPSAWRADIPLRVSLISGSTSWAHGKDMSMSFGTEQASASWDLIRVVVAHEFGHLIAYRYGPGTFAGAAPKGWPYSGAEPAEMWADCVQQAFIGIVMPSHGLGGCPSKALAWTKSWLAGGPSAHEPRE